MKRKKAIKGAIPDMCGIYRTLEDHPGWTAGMIADELGISLSKSYTNLMRLHDIGAVTRHRSGRDIQFTLSPDYDLVDTVLRIMGTCPDDARNAVRTALSISPLALKKPGDGSL